MRSAIVNATQRAILGASNWRAYGILAMQREDVVRFEFPHEDSITVRIHPTSGDVWMERGGVAIGNVAPLQPALFVRDIRALFGLSS